MMSRMNADGMLANIMSWIQVVNGNMLKEIKRNRGRKIAW